MFDFRWTHLKTYATQLINGLNGKAQKEILTWVCNVSEWKLTQPKDGKMKFYCSQKTTARMERNIYSCQW